ncbi:hypothetical protein P4645_15495 [Lysinibacillus fusiformis]|uniref:hypothetical protein n=1 Tax=Lysinibacillus fusiformis TaxID=28031 RepID=UPI002E249658|nr:hypothetical protein [Lysinibacillus fusiformis]
MSQFKSALLLMMLFISFFLPAFVNFGIGAIHYTGFFRTTLDLADYVRVEGGVSDNIKSYVSSLEERGYEISFYDSKTKQPINSVAQVGTDIEISYKYSYKDMKKEKHLDTTNNVLVLKRNN